MTLGDALPRPLEPVPESLFDDSEHSQLTRVRCTVLRQRLELSPPFRYHISFGSQGFPVFFTGSPRGWQPLRKLGLALTLVGAALAVPVQARESAPGIDTVSLSQLPPEARATEKLIRSGGPFPYSKDGTVFGNRERLLPRQNRGYYREYTVKTPGARNRGARRIVCGGQVPTQPDACYYTQDHYASFRRIVQ